MLTSVLGRVGESAIKSSRTLVDVPIAEVRAGHGDIDEILKVIDAESTIIELAESKVMSLLT